MGEIETGHYVEILIDGEPVGRGVVVNISSAWTRVATEADLSGFPIDFWTSSQGERYVDVRPSGRVALRRSAFYEKETKR